MLFLVKIVRATNDNVASMFYNATGSLVAYFWVGFALSIFSLICVFLVMMIHESVIENEMVNEIAV
jgi:ABC-type bacteriocin/lantibiotic exporter with double-glycine peptidase domain